MPKRVLSPEQIAIDAYIAHVVTELYQGLPAGARSWKAVAEKLDVSDAHANQAARGIKAGPKLEKVIARRNFRGSWDSLRDEAVRWYATQGPRPTSKPEASPSTPTIPRWAQSLPWPRMLPAILAGIDAGADEAFLREWAHRERDYADAETTAFSWMRELELELERRRRDDARDAAYRDGRLVVREPSGEHAHSRKRTTAK